MLSSERLQPLAGWPLAARQKLKGVFTDIDDTLTTDGAISPDALQALNNLRAAGFAIVPITSSAQLLRFSDACGAEIPRWIRLRLQAYGDDTESIKAFGLDVVADLCEQLVNGGVPAIHFYTMNQSAATLAMVQRLGLSSEHRP